MKHKLILINFLAAIILAACLLPASKEVVVESVAPYQDIRNKDVSHLGTLGESLIQTLWFNEATIWSAPDKSVAAGIMQMGKNPGLGIRALHGQGVTGKGVNVAIIDQNMIPDHPEFRGRIVKYHDVGTNTGVDEGSMHGPAVTSLLVGEKVGTAPEANVYYVAAPSWTGDAQYYADALSWIVEENAELPAGEKIRVVSVSAIPSGEGSPFTRNNDAWDAAYQRATEAGILVLDCTKKNRVISPCTYDLHDPDNIAKCIPGYPGAGNYQPNKNHIHVPAPYRTTAEEYKLGHFSYQFDGQGGLSWSVPYLAGVLAMGWQVNPELTSAQLLDMVFTTAYVTEGNVKVINPPAFIEKVKLSINK